MKIVIIRPLFAGNIGAVARVMANFDFKDLVLIQPECDHLSKEALDRAKHAKFILKKAKIKDIPYLKQFNYVIGTTAQIGTGFNIPRSPVDLEEVVKAIPSKSKVAIVFGSEGTGLTNEEVELCDFVIKIPSSKKYKTLNLSHAVAIVLYEFFSVDKKASHTPASLQDKKTIGKFFDKLLDTLTFATPEKKETQRKVWNKIFAKAMLTKREAFSVLGLIKKLLGER
ncbi:RNA methyltransferase [Nanoarchaeota archaeon]